MKPFLYAKLSAFKSASFWHFRRCDLPFQFTTFYVFLLLFDTPLALVDYVAARLIW